MLELTFKFSLIRDRMQIKGDTRKLLAAIVFFISFALLLRFVDLFRNGVEQNFIFFWLLILCIFTSVMYQIFRFGNSGGWQWLIIFQIMLITFFFQTISLLLTDGSLLLGDDAYVLFRSAQYIKGHPDFFITGPEYSKWPISQLLALATSELCNIKLFTVFKFLPSMVSTLGILFVYLIAREVYDTRRGGLLACLLFGAFWFFGLTHSYFHPQFLGFFFLLACLFAYFKSTKTGYPNIKYISMVILFMLAIMATNYTSNAFLVAFFIVALIYGMLGKYLKEPSPTTTGSWSTSFTLVALALVAWLAYAMYITEPLFSYVTRTATDLVAPVHAGSETVRLLGEARPEPALRSYISNWGHIAYVFIFGAMMMYEILWARSCNHRHTDLLFTSWGGFGLLVYLGMVIFITTAFGASLGHRIQVFVYPFILMMVAHIILRLGGEKRRKLLGLLLIGFLLINVASFSFVPPNLVGYASQPVSQGDWNQENRASEWLPGDEPVVTAYGLKLSLIHTTGTRPYFGIDAFEDDMSGLKSFSWLCLTESPTFQVKSEEYYRSENKLLDEQTLLKISQTSWLHKVYGNGEWEMYRIAPEHGNK